MSSVSHDEMVQLRSIQRLIKTDMDFASVAGFWNQKRMTLPSFSAMFHDRRDKRAVADFEVELALRYRNGEG